MSNKSLPEPGSVQYITVERVSNGFLITCPENMNDNNCKYIKPTINGVVSFMEHVWGTPVIKVNNNEKIIEELRKEFKDEQPMPVRKKK